MGRLVMVEGAMPSGGAPNPLLWDNHGLLLGLVVGWKWGSDSSRVQRDRA